MPPRGVYEQELKPAFITVTLEQATTRESRRDGTEARRIEKMKPASRKKQKGWLPASFLVQVAWTPCNSSVTKSYFHLL